MCIGTEIATRRARRDLLGVERLDGEVEDARDVARALEERRRPGDGQRLVAQLVARDEEDRRRARASVPVYRSCYGDALIQIRRGGPRMAVKITIRPNGPYLVEGDVELVDVNGNKVDTSAEAADRAVPLRRVGDEAVLRRDAQQGRVPGGGGRRRAGEEEA